MINWLGQNIEVDSIVGREKNEYGDTKIGKVLRIDEKGVYVRWIADGGWSGSGQLTKYGTVGAPKPISPHRLFVLSPLSFSIEMRNIIGEAK